MCNWKEKIVAIKIQLQEFKEQLKPFLNSEKKTALQTQLNSVEQTINKLNKTGIEIPAELRDLKFRLLSDIDKFKEASATLRELEEVLLPYVRSNKAYKKPTKEKTIKKKHDQISRIRVGLKDLINAKILGPNTNLYRKYKNDIYKAILVPEGQIKLTLKGETKFFDNPSSAAVTATGGSQNGWTWWYVEGDVQDRTLDYYRQQYITKQYETRR